MVDLGGIEPPSRNSKHRTGIYKLGKFYLRHGQNLQESMIYLYFKVDRITLQLTNYLGEVFNDSSQTWFVMTIGPR